MSTAITMNQSAPRSATGIPNIWLYTLVVTLVQLMMLVEGQLSGIRASNDWAVRYTETPKPIRLKSKANSFVLSIGRFNTNRCVSFICFAFSTTLVYK
ncbi:MAG: hypothetical protein QW429_02325 [Thermoprotei archaeon]